MRLATYADCCTAGSSRSVRVLLVAPRMHCIAVRLYSLLSCVLLAAGPTIAHAQSAGAAGRRAPDAVGLWLAVAPNSPYLTRMGTERRDFYALALHADWTLGSFPGVTLSYSGDILPIVASTNNVNGFEARPCDSGELPGQCFRTVLRTGTVYGTGLSPLGLTATVGPFASFSIQLGVNAGALWFTRAVPDPEAQRFNFTLAGRAGVEVPLRARYAALIGYMRHHTSNGGMARANPGLDSHMFYLGMTRRRTSAEKAHRFGSITGRSD
jgi:hypothetical protein